MCDVRFSLLISSDLGALFEISHLVHSSFSILDLVHGFVFPLVWILLRPSSWFASCSILTLGLGPHGAGARHFTGSRLHRHRKPGSNKPSFFTANFIPSPDSSSTRADFSPLHLGLRSTRFHFRLGVTRWLVSAVHEQGSPASVQVWFLLVRYRSCSRFSQGNWSPWFLFRSFYSRQVQHPWLLQLVDFSWSLVCSSRSTPHQRFLLWTLFPSLVFALSISWSTPGA
jgi:hypothetical protein